MEVTFGYFDRTRELVPSWQPIHCFFLVKNLICLLEFMEAETSGMFTSFAHIWLRKMSSTETEQIRLTRPAGVVRTIILSYAHYFQDWLSAFLIDNCASFTAWSEEWPVAG